MLNKHASGGTLHGSIMNLQSRLPADMKDNKELALAYKTGHKDARHDAAELSLDSESRIEALEREITRLKAIIEARESELDSDDNGQIPAGYVLLPEEPSPGLLMSMAIRNDHGLGVAGYYDQFQPQLGHHAQRIENAIGSMRRLYDEVVGKGFYSPERESYYVDSYRCGVAQPPQLSAKEASFIVTEEMIAEGKKVSDDKYTASVVESLDGGLGGGMKMSEAPPEIAKYFGCKKSGAQAFFEAMDDLSPSPYGKPPTLEMIKAGNDRLSLILEIVFSSNKVKAGKLVESSGSSEIDYLISSDEPPVALAYRAMRAAAKD